jgi:hypothetical protein
MLQLFLLMKGWRILHVTLIGSDMLYVCKSGCRNDCKAKLQSDQTILVRNETALNRPESDSTEIM